MEIVVSMFLIQFFIRIALVNSNHHHWLYFTGSFDSLYKFPKNICLSSPITLWEVIEGSDPHVEFHFGLLYFSNQLEKHFCDTFSFSFKYWKQFSDFSSSSSVRTVVLLKKYFLFSFTGWKEYFWWKWKQGLLPYTFTVWLCFRR